MMRRAETIAELAEANSLGLHDSSRTTWRRGVTRLRAEERYQILLTRTADISDVRRSGRQIVVMDKRKLFRGDVTSKASTFFEKAGGTKAELCSWRSGRE